MEGSFASVIGGAPASATVFAREVKARTNRDPRVRAAAERLRAATGATAGALRAQLAETTATVRSAKRRIIAAAELRPYIVDALERGMAGRTQRPEIR